MKRYGRGCDPADGADRPAPSDADDTPSVRGVPAADDGAAWLLSLQRSLILSRRVIRGCLGEWDESDPPPRQRSRGASRGARLRNCDKFRGDRRILCRPLGPTMPGTHRATSAPHQMTIGRRVAFRAKPKRAGSSARMTRPTDSERITDVKLWCAGMPDRELSGQVAPCGA